MEGWERDNGREVEKWGGRGKRIKENDKEKEGRKMGRGKEREAGSKEGWVTWRELARRVREGERGNEEDGLLEREREELMD